MISYTIFERKSLKSPKNGLSGDGIEKPGKSHDVPGVVCFYGISNRTVQRYKKTGAFPNGPV